VEEALASIAGKYDLVLGYNPTTPTAPWRRYIPSAPSALNSLTELLPGQGYWVRMTQAATLTAVLEGYPP
jgi:hypothetical protein